MQPNAPSKPIWLVGMISGILGIVGNYVHVSGLSQYSFWLLLVGFVALALGTALKGL